MSTYYNINSGISRYAQYYFQNIIATLVAVVLIFFGIYQIKTPNTHTRNVKFTVTNVHSRQTYNQDGTISYNSTVIGNVDGCDGPKTINSYPYYVRIGDVLTNVYMRPDCKGNDVLQSPLDNKVSGGICIFIGIIVLLFSTKNMFFLPSIF
jgi:hypothetical protein